MSTTARAKSAAPPGCHAPGRLPAKWRAVLSGIPGYAPTRDAEGCWFDPAAAQHALDFFPECLKHVEGDLAGEPFELQPWQAAIVANLFGWKRKDRKGRTVRRYREAFIYVPRGNGKALALETPLPTPGGWTTMGEVRVGDELFDDRGEVCRVTGATGVMTGRTCYRVAFSDGTAIIADAEHLWETDARTDRDRLKGRGGWNKGPKPSVKTTEQIRDTLNLWRAERAGKVERNHRIRVAGALNLPRSALPVEPYALGVWLGDGNSDAARLTYSTDDAELVGHLAEAGVTVGAGRRDPRSKAVAATMSFTDDGTTCRRGHLRADHGNARGRCLACERETDYSRQRGLPVPDYLRFSLQQTLRLLGVLGDKHIPPAYLRGSIGQRLALMRGLMDTDGYVSKDGQCEFTTTNRRLRDGFLELARGLGYKPTLKTARATVGGRDCGEKYRIQFWSFADRPCVRLSRKAERLRRKPADTRSQVRQIIAVDPVPSVPVKCIEVDSPSRLYLAGEGMVPTHNTCFAAGLCLFVLLCDGEPGAQVYSAAAEREQAALLFRHAKGMVEQEPELSGRCRIYGGIGQRSIVLKGDEASSYRVLSADAFSKHGFNTHCAIVDELHAHPGRELVDVLKTSMGKQNRKQPLMVYITTADYHRESICNEKYDYSCKVRDGVILDPTHLPVVYEATVGADWTSPVTWRRANPNYSVSVSEDYLEAECAKAKEIPEYENTFKRLHLNLRTESDVRWLSGPLWDDNGGPFDPADLDGRDCYAGLDLANTLDCSALVLLFPPEPDGPPEFAPSRWHVLPFFWVPEEVARHRERKNKTKYDAWIAKGHMLTTPGDVTDYSFIRERAKELNSRYRIQKLAFDPYNATHLSLELMDAGLRCEQFVQSITNYAEPCRKLEEMLLSRDLAHGGHPVLRWMASNVSVHTDGRGYKMPSRKKSTDKIDGIAALLMALGAALADEAGRASVYEGKGLEFL